MHVHLPNRSARERIGEYAHNEMMVGGKGVVAPLLLRREVPMGIQPTGIARGQQQSPGAVGFGQRRFFPFGPARGRRRSQRILLSRASQGE